MPNNEEHGVLNSIEQLYKFVGELKKTSRHLFQNIYMDSKEMQESISNGELFFYYLPGGYLNVIKREWDFLRLYFYIADITKYKVCSMSEKMVCDIFFYDRDERINTLLDVLLYVGFREYASFAKYAKYGDELYDNGDFSYIKMGRAKGFYETIRACFDVYTDYIPEENEIATFFENKFCYSYVGKGEHLCGGAVISAKGLVATEEFVFVVPKFRGNGISNILRSYGHAYTGKYYEKNIRQYVSWVNDKNVASWKHLMKMGYTIDNVHKITFMK